MEFTMMSVDTVAPRPGTKDERSEFSTCNEGFVMTVHTRAIERFARDDIARAHILVDLPPAAAYEKFRHDINRWWPRASETMLVLPLWLVSAAALASKSSAGWRRSA